MNNIQLVTENKPTRCEICHQSDRFNQEKSFCHRCDKQPAVKNLKTSSKIVIEESPQSLTITFKLFNWVKGLYILLLFSLLTFVYYQSETLAMLMLLPFMGYVSCCLTEKCIFKVTDNTLIIRYGFFPFITQVDIKLLEIINFGYKKVLMEDILYIDNRDNEQLNLFYELAAKNEIIFISDKLNEMAFHRR
jgi:hypothetical protein